MASPGERTSTGTEPGLLASTASRRSKLVDRLVAAARSHLHQAEVEEAEGIVGRERQRLHQRGARALQVLAADLEQAALHQLVGALAAFGEGALARLEEEVDELLAVVLRLERVVGQVGEPLA